MKRLFILVIALAVMPFASINAQDARNRVTSTIIADALAAQTAVGQLLFQSLDEFGLLLAAVGGFHFRQFQ